MNEDSNNIIKKSMKEEVDSYEEGLKRLESIVANMENKDNSFSDLLANMDEANLLVKDCENRLRGIEGGIFE